MKNKLLLTFLLVPSIVFATNTPVTKPHPGTGANTVGVASANSAEAATTSSSIVTSTTGPTTNTVSISGDQAVKNTPSLFSGALTSSHDTCLGSASGGIATAGFGFSIGGTNVDKNCVMRKNADLLHRMGMSAAALALVCAEDESIKKALQATGFKCPE